MNVSEMAAHVWQIADENLVTVGSHSSGGAAYRKSRVITIRPVKSIVTYAIALHELGHVLGRQSGIRLEREGDAWQWAIDNALPDALTARFYAEANRCLSGYVEWVRRRGGWMPGAKVLTGRGIVDGNDPSVAGIYRGLPKAPPEGHRFWTLLEHVRSEGSVP